MNLLPLQLILGFQVAVAAVIAIHLMTGNEEGGTFRRQKRDNARNANRYFH